MVKTTRPYRRGMARLLASSMMVLCSIFAVAEDYDAPYAYTEVELVESPRPMGLSADDLRQLSLEDKILRLAYNYLVLGAHEGPEITDDRTPDFLEALKDLKRRGNSATPLLLDIMEKNHNSRLEFLVPWVVVRIKTLILILI